MRRPSAQASPLAPVRPPGWGASAPVAAAGAPQDSRGAAAAAKRQRQRQQREERQQPGRRRGGRRLTGAGRAQRPPVTREWRATRPRRLQGGGSEREQGERYAARERQEFCGLTCAARPEPLNRQQVQRAASLELRSWWTAWRAALRAERRFGATAWPACALAGQLGGRAGGARVARGGS